MKWITRKALQAEFDLSWAVAETILARECNAMRYGGWRLGPVVVSALWLGSMFWILAGAKLALPSVAHAGRVLAELPGVALAFVALVVLPRLLATHAILAAAENARGDRSMVVSDTITESRPAKKRA